MGYQRGVAEGDPKDWTIEELSSYVAKLAGEIESTKASKRQCEQGAARCDRDLESYRMKLDTTRKILFGKLEALEGAQ